MFLQNQAWHDMIAGQPLCVVGLADLWSGDLDLMLSGHIHGGQCRVPGWGAPVLPVRDRWFSHGLYTWMGRQLYITRGVGSLWDIRFNCMPEATILEWT